jgi:ketosteroid isomerase-like protein
MVKGVVFSVGFQDSLCLINSALCPQKDIIMTARTDDYDAIVRVVRLYIDAFNENDISRLREAFDEDAWIFFVDADGVLHKNLISESFEKWAAPPSWGVVGRIISVSQVGDAASVQLSFDSDKIGGWIDFHNLLRINGGWKITNKTATHSSR